MREDVGDRLGRPLKDLRISVTDRCNFRCRYCMPREVFGNDFPFLEKDGIMSFEEIDRLAGLFIRLGVEKFALQAASPCYERIYRSHFHAFNEGRGNRDDNKWSPPSEIRPCSICSRPRSRHCESRCNR